MKVKIDDVIRYIKNGEFNVDIDDLKMACTDDELFESRFENISEFQYNDDVLEAISDIKDKLNPEILLLRGIRNVVESIEYANKQIADKKREVKPIKDKKNMDDLGRILRAEKNIKKAEQSIKNLRNNYKGLNCIYVRSVMYNNAPFLDILDSRIIIDQEKSNRSKKQRQLHEIHKMFSQISGDNKTAYDLIGSSIDASDILSVFPSENFRVEIQDYMINKTLWNAGFKNSTAIYNERRNNAEDFCEKYIGDNEDEVMNKFILPILDEFIEYADIDKLVMIYAYRLMNYAETQDLSKGDVEAIRRVSLEILKYCEKNKIPDNYKINCIGEDESEGFEVDKTVDFSPKTIKKFMKNFQNGIYYNKEKRDMLREEIRKGEKYLDEVPPQLLGSLFNTEEYEKLLFSNDKNFKFLSSVLKMENETIMRIAIKDGINSAEKIDLLLKNNVIDTVELTKLYILDYFDLDVLIDAVKDREVRFDYSDIVNLYYDSIDEENESEVDLKECYERYVDLCLALIVRKVSSNPENSETIRKEASEELMEIIAEKYDESKRELYIKQIEELYKKELLQLESVVNWEDERIIARFLQDEVIDSNDVKKLIDDKIISVEYAQGLFQESILDPEMDSETRLEFIRKGLVSEEYIGKAYQELLINSLQAEELEKEGYFKRSKYELGLEELQKKSNVELIELGDLSALTKIRGEGDGRSSSYSCENKGVLIDPSAREDLFMLMGAKRAISSKIKPGSAFYNYEFYVLPNEDGEYDLDSVVIGEKYFTSKDRPKTFSTGDATYFFKWRDLLYLSNLKKTEIIKESKDIVFKANHVTSDGEEKEGRWGNSTITAIGKTMMGIAVRQFTKKAIGKIAKNRLKKLYDMDEWININNHAANIDCGDHNLKLLKQNSSEDSSPGGDGNR